ncbi:MAG: hypothetical protein R3F61_13150 [Myxococcota bacterium]
MITLLLACGPTPPPTVDATSVCEAFTALDRTEVVWSGDSDTCDPGTADGVERASDLFDLARVMVGLEPVPLDPAASVAAQECALLLHANDALSHEPPSDWACWTEARADAAESSLLASGPLVLAAPGFLVDPGNEDTLGHRRWILSNRVQAFGFGSTDAYSCISLVEEAEEGRQWTAWPPPGPVPRAMLEAYGVSVDEVGWSIQSDVIDLPALTVQVSLDGADPVTVDTVALPGGFGSVSAIRFGAPGWSAADRIRVQADGGDISIAYEVVPVDCP